MATLTLTQYDRNQSSASPPPAGVNLSAAQTGNGQSTNVTNTADFFI
jgi:hypothetical protein